jgi:chloramphenicol 3-O-phosphotransferase
MTAEQAFVLLITGPAGAGKSAAAEAWAVSQARPTAHIELDVVREFVRSGWADPQDGWSPETNWQYTIARRQCADMARRYVAEGITCVIDDAIFPLWESVNYAGWSELLHGTPHCMVVLLPSYAAITARNSQRQGRRLLAPTMLRTIYDMMLPWREQSDFPIVESSTLTVAEVTKELQRIVTHMRESGQLTVE